MSASAGAFASVPLDGRALHELLSIVVVTSPVCSNPSSELIDATLGCGVRAKSAAGCACLGLRFAPSFASLLLTAVRSSLMVAYGGEGLTRCPIFVAADGVACDEAGYAPPIWFSLLV